MDTIEIKLRDEYIKLGQALKAAHIADSGVDAKFMVLDGKVLVNGETELQRGKKLHAGDEVVCGNARIRICAHDA
ncbi:MAG: RNA-binding S4 domain-containing protein [Lachnospiraceae bacterium]|nr:RNA-binding S4 domain-containing protein [Lachnospiraceae bacterium]